VMPSRRSILGRSLLLGLIGGAVMGQVALLVLAVWLTAERL
jgi:hypothetical protein